jgi:hypothetical protein
MECRPEDVLHMIFKCQSAASIWRALGIDRVITDACLVDRSGSVVLEELLKSPPLPLPGYSSIKIHEIVAIAAWYIWWFCRRQTHGENIPPFF